MTFMQRLDVQCRWAVGLSFIAAGTLLAQSSNDGLLQGFQRPPDSAKPRVWWHWMNGNITKEGIKLDLEWMKRVGIAGFQNFDAAFSTPQVVEKRLAYMTPEWRDALRYTATLADELGLEMAIAGSPGWSETGGPWVPQAQAMKKLVWSETRLEGGRPFSGALPKPPSTTGPFQNMGGGRGIAELVGPGHAPPPEYYADTAVIAYLLPDSDVPIAELRPKVTSSAGAIDLAALADGDLAKTTDLPMAPANEKAWIQFEFAAPQTLRAFTLVTFGGFRNPFAPPGDSGNELQASDDGSAFRTVAKVPDGGAPAHTLAFPAVTAKFFRVTFATPPPSRGFGIDIPGLRLPPTPTSHRIAELVLHTGARVNRYEEKAGFAAVPELYSLATPSLPARDAIAKTTVVDLTSMMKSDGSLDWTPPAGRWNLLRMGYSLLGITNHPASPEATGLEVDKLSRGAVKAYIDHYLDQYKETVGALMGKRGLQYVVTDSWEAGTQNWTDDMIAEFSKRRGYDPHPWLPVLTGRVIESAEASDRFLWDFRKTIAELTAEYHYDQIGASLHERGMGRYTESHESGRAFIGDGMDVKKNADIPMSATWTPRPGESGEPYGSNADVRESASVAHIYGQNLVAAESLTAIGTPWAWSPETLKPTADKEMANGLNRFVIHTSVHQPVSDKVPGLSLGPFGQWFTRHETWAELAKPWTTYLARSSYMLQQGLFVADVLYFYGEDSNITALFSARSPEVPAGYNFDYASADALMHRVSVDGGLLTTPNGMRYRALVLDPNSRHMSLPVLQKIRDLVGAGASVVGPKPAESPSLRDDQAEFRRIADQIWGPGSGQRTFGKGRVFAGKTTAEAMSALKVLPDFEYTKPVGDTTLLFVHRKVNDGEIYWVNNRNDRPEMVEATFRVRGKSAELWDPETGRVTPASYKSANGRTTVPLRLQPNDAVFVVFRQTASADSRTLPLPVEASLATIDGPWEVSFQPNRGAPTSITLERLTSWADNTDEGVKYFSGTGTYARTVQVPAAWIRSGTRLWLDLGEVKNLAEVFLNGKPLGVAWKKPFRVDATSAVRPGANDIQVKVTNLWVNRLIGDQQPGAKKYTYTSQQFYRADSHLQPSGLLGPVQILQVANE